MSVNVDISDNKFSKNQVSIKKVNISGLNQPMEIPTQLIAEIRTRTYRVIFPLPFRVIIKFTN